MKLLPLLIPLFYLQAFGLEEKAQISRKRTEYIKLDPLKEDQVESEFEISAEEEARLERFLQATSLSLSVTTTAPTLSPIAAGTPTASPVKAGTPTASPSRSPIQAGTPTASPSRSPIQAGTPTASPIVSTGSPTKSPSRSPTLYTAKCRDDPDYYHKFEMRTCKFIDKKGWRRKKYCQYGKVYRNCERTCGRCCEDTHKTMFRFEANGKLQDCNWLKLGIDDNRPREYCSLDVGDGTVADYCPDSCGKCRKDNLRPTPSPVAVCGNDEDWTFFGFPVITCKWIRNQENRREQYCNKGTKVSDFCPQTCGFCCEDNINFSFRDVKLRKDITCAYIARREDRKKQYCPLWRNDNMVRDICPLACDSCLTRIGPTSPPTTFAQGCQNNPDWYWSSNTDATCSWIRNKEERRKDFCNRDDIVKQECPQSCGVCCEDDPTYVMDKKTKIKTCFWVSQTSWRINNLCKTYENGRMVQDACPQTCKKCLSSV